MRDPRRKRGLTPVDRIIGTVLGNLDMPEDTAQRGRAMIVWEEISGNAADHTRPVSFRGKTLVVEVSHPSWMNELSLRKSELLGKLEEKVGKGVVGDIRFTMKRDQD